MTHSLAWAFEVSGLTPHQVFAFDGKSSAGVDYYDSATVRCTNGATMVLSGAATALIGQGTRVEIFGDKGTLTYNAGEVKVAVRGPDGEPNIAVPVAADPSRGDTPIGQAGLWRLPPPREWLLRYMYSSGQRGRAEGLGSRSGILRLHATVWY